MTEAQKAQAWDHMKATFVELVASFPQDNTYSIYAASGLRMMKAAEDDILKGMEKK